MKLRFRLLVAWMMACVIILMTANVCLAWKFASTSDSQGDENGVNVAVFSKIIDLVNKEGVDLLIMQGDLVSGSSDEGKLASQYDTWLSVISKLNCPYYVIPGNHDAGSLTSEDVWRTKLNMPANGPDGYKETVWSFDHKNVHFIGLHSNHPGEVHTIQQEWLEKDLKNNSRRHIIAMSHEPAFSKGGRKGNQLGNFPEKRDMFWKTLAESGCRLFFCGHEHYYSWSLEGSVYQCINGPSGGIRRTGFPNTIGHYNYVVVTVDGADLHGVAKNDRGEVIHTWDIPGASSAQTGD